MSSNSSLLHIRIQNEKLSVEIQESYANIQVDKGTIRIDEDVKENVLKVINNNQIQNILPANINTTKLGIITPLTQDIQDKNENVPLIKSTGGIEDNDKSMNFFKKVKKLFVKSARTKKLSLDKLSPKLRDSYIKLPNLLQFKYK